MPDESRFSVETSPACIRCRYRVWAVGIGQGFWCSNAKKHDAEGIAPTPNGFRRFNIPGVNYRTYYCEFFEINWNKVRISDAHRRHLYEQSVRGGLTGDDVNLWDAVNPALKCFFEREQVIQKEYRSLIYKRGSTLAANERRIREQMSASRLSFRRGEITGAEHSRAMKKCRVEIKKLQTKYHAHIVELVGSYVPPK
ncbi:MAG: hypothetical protein HYX66_04440 [Ignavibacteria bacterium]|nr:hypothetical protein [Ignavibacteria bacterium]